MFKAEEGVRVEPAEELKCHPSCTYGTANESPTSPICRKHRQERESKEVARVEEAKTAAPETPVAAAAPEAPPSPNPLTDVKFPALDNLGSHFYDNEAGTFWVGLNLRGDVMVLPLLLDGAKMPLIQAALDFRGREARKQSLIARVKETATGMKEGLEKMLGRVGAGKKSILSR